MKVGEKVIIAIPTYDDSKKLIMEGGKPVTEDVEGVIERYDGFTYTVKMENGESIMVNKVKPIVEKTVEVENTTSDSGPAPLESDKSPVIFGDEYEKKINLKEKLLKKGKKK